MLPLKFTFRVAWPDSFRAGADEDDESMDSVARGSLLSLQSGSVIGGGSGVLLAGAPPSALANDGGGDDQARYEEGSKPRDRLPSSRGGSFSTIGSEELRGLVA